MLIYTGHGIGLTRFSLEDAEDYLSTLYLRSMFQVLCISKMTYLHVNGNAEIFIYKFLFIMIQY